MSIKLFLRHGTDSNVPLAREEKKSILQNNMAIDNNKEIWIFLSHSNKDFAKVRKIRNYLEERSCRPLMFYLKCLSNDEEIDDLIKREIDCRTRFIICDSENSQASKWVQSEVKYIKSQQRSYETIDLSKSEDEIKSQLDKLVKGTQIFFSYSRNDYELVKAVYSHICKYDIRCFFDAENLNSGDDFQKQINHAISLAKDFGFVVFFASQHSLSSRFCMAEIQEAVRLGANVFLLLLDKYAKDHIKEYFPQSCDKTQSGGYPIRDSFLTKDISMTNSDDSRIEMAIEEIVNRTFPFWDSYTMALNFLKGIDIPQDIDEANRLFSIVYRKADDLDTIGYPGGTLFLARCEANGYGTKKDLHSALMDYQNYIGMCGSNENIDREIAEIKQELGEL